MAILQIEDTAYLEMLSRFPEAAMGYYLVEVRDTVAIAVGGYVVFELTPQLMEELDSLLSEQQWLRPDADLTIEQRQESFRAWLRGLRSAGFPRGVPASRADMTAAIVVGTGGSPPRPPQPPANIYGHLPFPAVSESRDVFYRCEPFPLSRYIDQATGRVTAHKGMYGLPSSDLPFVPTGFSAVGRYALPSLLPSTFRWELQPPAQTPFRCGASVPLYGQAGGVASKSVFTTTFRTAGR
jgi:hypothetical protein